MLAAHVSLLTNANASSGQTFWMGGMGIFSVVGTFGGATVSLQFLGPDGATLVTAGGNTTLTAPGAGVFYLPPCQIQATVTGGSPSALYAAADRVPQ